jgi:Trm5-related predicted tRNA methylase
LPVYSIGKIVFSDPNARMIFDPEHSRDEDRFILLGISTGM